MNQISKFLPLLCSLPIVGMAQQVGSVKVFKTGKTKLSAASLHQATLNNDQSSLKVITN